RCARPRSPRADPTSAQHRVVARRATGCWNRHRGGRCTPRASRRSPDRARRRPGSADRPEWTTGRMRMRMWMRGHTTTRLGPAFGWLWSAYAASALGAALGFGAFPLIAVAVLGAGPAGVSALAAAATAVGALSALPLGPWVE